MNAKERFYSGLAKETIGKITSNTDNWTSFLRTMSRNYEFTYPEQVMIYAQRPNATFCKPYEDWNAENYRRYVKRGSTGIALFVMNRDKPYLRYVFDVADTGVRRSSPELKPWEVTPENRSYVMEAMERTFGVAADGVLEAQLEDIASALAAEYWDDYKKQFLDIVANSFLEEYDELNIEVAFKNAVANSVSYTMYCRFVESPDNYFEHEDFQKVFDFNTRQTVNALGTAVNAISTRMFQEIEKAIGEHEQIKATERSTDYERDDLQTGRRLSDSEPSVGERGRETSGQVRQDASSIFGTEQSDAPERHDSDGEPVPAPVGDRGNSESQSGVSDGAVPEGQPRTGQGNAADGVGAAHEQPESTGGGSRDDGAYQQLSLNLFLSENEQISFIDRAESFTPSAFSFAQEEIDHFLLLGSNTDEARKVVALEYMKQKPLEEIVQTLKQVYHGGYGLKEDSGNICAWYAEDGIHLAKGSSAIDSPRAQIVSWETVAERIGELLENGRFATNVELVEASGYERQKLAESLWHLYHDLSEEARSSNYLAILHQEPFRGFPDETADLAEKLDDPRFHATLVQQYSEFRKTLAENPDLLRFHYHKLNLIQKQLYELNMPLREYQTDMMQMPLVRQFITDDEVNADLTRGSGFSGGKARIYNYWQENHSAKEKMDFLKHEYGTGGHSHACSGATHSGQDHDAKQYNQMQVPLKELSNLPHRHEGYDSKTFAIQIDGKWFGITYAFITHSRYESKPFDQKMTPYTEDGRRRYVNYRTKHKPLPCDRPSINTPEDIALSIYASGKGWKANFEYFMNREYAYNRDKGKCKCCGRYFSELIPKHCHHVNPRLPIERINKVPNLAWLCIPCHRMVHNSPIPPELDAKAVRKIKKYREKLKK